MACIYILFSYKTRKFYIGSSREDVPDKRIKSHNNGKVRSTKFGRPWILVHTETLKTYKDARKRESFLKSGKGREWIYNKFSYLKEGCAERLRHRS